MRICAFKIEKWEPSFSIHMFCRHGFSSVPYTEIPHDLHPMGFSFSHIVDMRILNGDLLKWPNI